MCQLSKPEPLCVLTISAGLPLIPDRLTMNHSVYIQYVLCVCLLLDFVIRLNSQSLLSHSWGVNMMFNMLTLGKSC